METVEEFKKTPADRDMILIYTRMQHTFALRREEIVTLAPPIAEFKARWPGLFSEAHVSKNILRNFNKTMVISHKHNYFMIWFKKLVVMSSG